MGQEKPTPFTLSYLQKTYGKDYIIQEVLQQSDELAQFNETSLNTLRVCVYKSVKTNECHVTGAAIRMGARGSLVDNVSSGGIFAGVSLDGTVAHCAFDKMGRRYTTFNGVDFTQPHKISNFQKVIEFALEVGKRVHNMHLIDLDIAIDKAGNPRLLEFNVSGFGMWLYHYTGVAPFGVFTEEILDYCRQNIGKIWYRIRL